MGFCESTGIRHLDHFRDITKMVELEIENNSRCVSVIYDNRYIMYRFK